MKVSIVDRFCMWVSIGVLLVARVSFAEITTTPSAHPFARGYSDVADCSGPWVRAKAQFLDDGTLLVFLGLETDSTTKGASGWAGFELKDRHDKTLMQGNTETFSIPPKEPGRARVVDLPAYKVQIPLDIASQVSSVHVFAHCKDAPFGLWDIGLLPEDEEFGVKLITPLSVSLERLSTLATGFQLNVPPKTFGAGLTRVGGHFIIDKERVTRFKTDSGWLFSIPEGHKLGENASVFNTKLVVSGASRQVEVTKTEFAHVSELENAISRLPESQQKATLENILKTVTETTNKAAVSDSTKELKNTVTTLGSSAGGIVRTFGALPQDEQAKQAGSLGVAYRALAQTARTASEKTVYGFDGQFRPITYKNIYEHCPSVGYLKYNGERTGTCFLIDSNRILTCLHCLQNPLDHTLRSVTKFTACFERDLANEEDVQSYPITRAVVVGPTFKAGSYSIEQLDCAVLELGPNELGKTPKEDGWNPLPISKVSPEHNDAVCVIGYPGIDNPKMVADNAHVFVPYEVNDDQRNAFRLDLAGEIEEKKRAAQLVSDEHQRDYQLSVLRLLEQKLTQEFTDSFVQTQVSSPGVTAWIFVSEFLNFQHPAFALDSSTFHGDSGAPVLLRKTSEVVGLFFRGYNDTYVSKVNWEAHEEAIPINVIMEAYKNAKNKITN